MHHVIDKRGFIWRHTAEMKMDKVEAANVDQSITVVSWAMASSTGWARDRTVFRAVRHGLADRRAQRHHSGRSIPPWTQPRDVAALCAVGGRDDNIGEA